MIYLFSGTPGSGKSLHTAQMIYWRLKRKKEIVANFDIDTSKIPKCNGKFTCLENDKMTVKYIEDYFYKWKETHKFKEGELLLIIDEAQIMFNAREWNAKGRSEWLNFFSNHRKYAFDIILIAQFDRMLDRQLRSLIEYEYIHRKVSNYGLGGKMLSLASGGNLFVSVNMWYPLRERIGSNFFKATKKYYSIYDSYKRFDEKTEYTGEIISDQTFLKKNLSEIIVASESAVGENAIQNMAPTILDNSNT